MSQNNWNDENGMTTASASLIVLEDFSNPHHTWEQMNDPVMGGQSVGTFTIDEDAGTGNFEGIVRIVPFLKAPGFIKAETKAPSSFPDVSSCQGLQLVFDASSEQLEYSGYRVSFGHNRPPDAFPFTYGYKADLKLDPSSQKVGEDIVAQLPFDSFTYKWDAGTGDARVTCEEDITCCPDEETLARNFYSIVIWGHGVEGDVELKIKQISAYDCFASDSASSFTTKTASALDAEQQDTVVESNKDGLPESGGDEIVLEDFGRPMNEWVTLNDPVMGGKSESSLTIANGVAHFQGQCNIVPSLQAPGFITMKTGGYMQPDAIFPDVSSCHGLKLVFRSTTAADYTGYYVSFGTIHLPEGGHASGFKIPLQNVPTGGSDGPEGGFGHVILPFSDFSAKWDEATGHILAPCGPDENSKYCPDDETLKDMKTMSIWGEGVEGTVDLEIQSIRAVGCASATTSSVSYMRANDIVQSPIAGGSAGHTLVGVIVLIAVFSLFIVFKRYTYTRSTGGSHSSVHQIQKNRSEYMEVNTPSADGQC